MNGIIHWDARPHRDFNSDDSKIIYFNLVSEKLGKLDLPSYDENEDVNWDLYSSKESLFGFRHCESQGAVDIWDGEVLLIDGERLVLFNTRNNIYKDLRIHIPDTHRRIDMVTYNETLVSPVFDDEDGCELW
ncbi:hypothetical protein H5410_029094 [Solanum commersonii]|uniref:Uncharacterized protein n=1 Tax=Solanum commersonii TaxID=4109 RepID=A0A9J5Z4L0_SOLCO|nr:hypothetical protein H5410_029094 [Solanum commersonii]